ncbi:MAG: glucosylceramidase, partial [Chitinophagaceae bacterium]|nr:glucosylceramidase [Chitinophagaceae bacterium]
AFTITGSAASPNVAYYIIAHASKFVTPGSVRIYSTNPDNLFNVAFKRPDGRKVLIVLNETAYSQNFNIKYNGKRIAPTLPAKSVGTFGW